MSDYARSHHPQVQARKHALAINNFRAKIYRSVLEGAGVSCRGLNKVEMYALVLRHGLEKNLRAYSWQNWQNVK